MDTSSYGTEFLFEFDAISIGSKIYAMVDITVDNNSKFSFRSADSTVQSGVNNLVCKAVEPEPIPVFYIRSTGNDTTGDGTESKPFKTIQKTMTLVTNDGTIWVMDTISIITDTSLDGRDNITLKRHSKHTGTLIEVAQDGALTLENITIDGQGGMNGLDGNIDATASLITVGVGATVTLNKNAILQNNKGAPFSYPDEGSPSYGVLGGAVNVVGGTLIMNDGIIRNNQAGVGGGVIDNGF